MRPYASWKYVVLLIALVISALYAAPNLYGQDWAVQVSLESGDPLPESAGTRVDAALKEAQIEPSSSRMESGHWVTRFSTAEAQLRANESIKKALGNDYVVALNFASKTPAWRRPL